MGPEETLSWSVLQETTENTVRALQGLRVGSSLVYLGDPPVPVWGQGITGATEAIIQEATGWRWYSQLGEKQHFIMAVAFGQLWHPVALPVTWARQAKGLATGFRRQLSRENRRTTRKVWYNSLTRFSKITFKAASYFPLCYNHVTAMIPQKWTHLIMTDMF